MNEQNNNLQSNEWKTIKQPFENNVEKIEQNYNYNNNEKNDNKKPIFGPLLKWILLIVLVIIIVLLLIKACSGNKENDLLKAGKEYYQSETKPEAEYECKTVSLAKLIDKGLLNEKKYKGCDKEATSVKVCQLEKGKYHYVPLLQCDTKIDDQFNDWSQGTVDNIKEDKTDLRFLYLGEKIDKASANFGKTLTLWEGDKVPFENYDVVKTITNYSYRDLEYKWISTGVSKLYYPGNKTTASGVKEYYVSSPASGYTNKDSANSKAAKWYKTTTKKASVSPGTGYVQGQTNGYAEGYSAAKPADKTYRRSIPVTAYRTRTITNANYQYVCSNSATSQVKLYSNIECNKRKDSFTFSKGRAYTCPGGVVSKDQYCRTAWSKWSQTPCTSASSLECEKLNMWYYRDTLWNWTRKSYYPSGSYQASSEKTYYIQAPASGYVKDPSTVTTAYKWYKKLSTGGTVYSATKPFAGATKTNETRWGNWSSFTPTKVTASSTREVKTKNQLTVKEIVENSLKWLPVTEGYVTEDELIASFISAGYKINSLYDVANNGEIRYQVQLNYRDKK